MGGGSSGGSGGGGGAYSDSSESEESSSNAEINDYLNSVLRDKINQKDVDKINQRKEELRRLLEQEFDEEINLSTGGSYSKQTYVNGLSDVDILYVLGDYSSSSISGKENSQNVLEHFKTRIEQRLPNTDIEVGAMAVTVKYSDGTELQILPAFKYYSGYKVPDPSTKGWTCTFPKKFQSELTSVNQSNGGKVVPTIKLTKKILKTNDIKVKGYHLETLATKAFENYNGKKTHKEMVTHFVKYMKKGVLKRAGDPCGQSEYVDNYLGKVRSSERRQLAKSLSNLEKKLISSKSSQNWKKLTEG